MLRTRICSFITYTFLKQEIVFVTIPLGIVSSDLDRYKYIIMLKMKIVCIVFLACVDLALPTSVLGARSVEINQEENARGRFVSSVPVYRESLQGGEIRVSKEPLVFLTPPPIPRSSIFPLSLPLNDSDSQASAVREKRQERQSPVDARSFNVDIGVGPGFPPGSIPLCFEREVKGTCRYRSSPDECFRHEWTAYATIINEGYKKITSIPDGLLVHPGGHPRVRVFLKISCCTPVVQFVAYDLFLQPSPCLVDVRELQDLHWGEIVGIVVGCFLFIIIVIVVIAMCVRYQRKKREKETVIFGRSLTRSKSGTGSMNHHHR